MVNNLFIAVNKMKFTTGIMDICIYRISLDTMADYTENQLTRRVAKLIKYGKINGFDKIDICPHKMMSPFAGRHYNLFHSNIKLDD